MNAIHREVLRDYGVTCDAAGMRAFAARTRPKRKITSAAQYVAACRAVGRGYELETPETDWCGLPVFRPLEGEGRIDGRLIAAGYNHESPTRWIREGGLYRFLEYWQACAIRPETVGSDYNPCVDQAYAFMRSGVPAWVARILGFVQRRDPEARLRRLPRRTRRRYADAARACARTSMGDHTGWRFSTRALAALGRLCPELQRVALEALKRDPRWDEWGYGDGQSVRRIRVRDIPWGEVARVQRQIAADSSGRVRVAWATGKRRKALFEAIHPPSTVRACLQSACMGAPPQVGTFAVPAGYQTKHLVAAVQLAEEDTYARRWRVTWHDEDLYGLVDEYIERLRPPPPTLSAWLAPSYPMVSEEQAARLARGETPVQLSDGQLTKKEAHLWLLGGGGEPLDWLCQRLPAGCPPVRSFAVARWLLDVHRRGAWGALTREREIPGPAGQRVVVRYLDRVDEIQDADLVRGPATGVDAAFERAAARAGAKWLDQARSDHRVLQSLPRGWRLYRCMRHLCTPAALVREGESMHHCVGSYSSAVEGGQSVILAINVTGHRSTVELAPSGRVLQHRGPYNSDPHPLCQRVLERFLRRIHASSVTTIAA